MSKKLRKLSANRRRFKKNRQFLIVLAVILVSGIALGTAVQPWRKIASLRNIIGARTSPPAAPQPTLPDASHPSKEYVYGNGKLLAIERPGKTDQTITFNSIANHTYGDAAFTISATASSGLPVSFTVVSGAVSVSGNTVTINGAGAASIRADQAGNDSYNPAPPVTQNFSVAKAAATISLGSLSATYDGNPKAASATTSPAGLSGVSITYNGSGTAPTNAGSYSVVASLNNANYTAPDASGTLVIAKASQTITFNALGNKTYGDAPFAVNASASSGLAVGFAILSGPATVSGNTVTLTGSGSVTVRASQSGNGNYNAAANVDRSFNVTQASATITLGSLSHTYDGNSKAATATTNPAGLSGVSLTYDGSSTAPTNAGSYAVVASLTNANYTAPNANGTLTIAKASQTITFNALGNKTYGDAPFAVSASASSGLSVSFSIVSGPATISGTTVTITGAGSVTVRAAQAGNANYNAAPNVDRTFTVAQAAATISLSNLSHTYNGNPKAATATTNPAGLSGVSLTYDGSSTAPTNVGSYAVVASLSNANYTAPNATGTLTIAKANQTITFDSIPPKTYTDAPFNLSASSTSGLTVTFSVVSGPVTVSGNVATITGVGLATIRASQAGNANYNAATDVNSFVTISKAEQTITFAAIPNKTFGDAPFNVSASASSGLPESLSIVSGPATISTKTITITGAGTVTVRASQGGNVNYLPASDVDRTFTVAQAGATISLSNLSHTYNGSPKAATATTNPAGLSGVSLTYDGSSTAPTNAGSYAVVASLSNANYTAPNASGTLTIGKANQTITFDSIPPKTYTDAPFNLSASSTSGLTVTFAVVSGPVTVSGNVATITGVGLATIRASQAGNANYNAAADVNGFVTIAKAEQTITFAALANKTFGDAPFNISASASSGLPESFSIVSGPATISSKTVTITGAGTVTVRASQAGNANYLPAPNVDQTFTVAKATPTITWGNPANINQGTSLGATQLNATANVPGTFVYSPTAGTILSVGNNQTLSTTFTPTDSANYNNATASVHINVVAACPTSVGSTFTSDPETINLGQSSTLAWNVPNATSVSIDFVAGTFSPSGNTEVSPSSTTSYTLTATGAIGCSPITKTALVMVQTCPSEEAVSFTTNLYTVEPGLEATLGWTAPDSSNVTIYTVTEENGETTIDILFSGFGTEGSLGVEPSETTVYYMTVYGPSGCDLITRQLTINAASPDCWSSAQFYAEPDTIDPYGEVGTIGPILTWRRVPAATITISDSRGVLLGTFTDGDSMFIQPRATTTYTLTGTGGDPPCQKFAMQATVTVLQ